MKKFQTQTQPLALCGRANFLWGGMTDGQIVIGAADDDDVDSGRAESRSSSHTLAAGQGMSHL